MYEVWKIERGTSSMVDLQRDPAVAKQHVLEQSRLSSAVFYVARQGFGSPLYFVLDGIIGDPAEVMRRMGAPTRPAPLRFEPAGVIEDVEPFSAPNATEEAEVSEAPKPRRKPRPAETKSRKAVEKEYKQAPAFIVKSQVSDDGKTGVVDALVSVYGVLDDGNDIICGSFFAKSIAENGHRVKVLNSHNTRDVAQMVARPMSLWEVGREGLPPEVLARWPEAIGGLMTTSQFMLNDPGSKAVYDRLSAGWIDEWSIGFDDLQSDMAKVKRIYDGASWRFAPAMSGDVTDTLVMDGEGRPVVARWLRQGRLWEYSPVLWGMNAATTTVSVKDTDGNTQICTGDGSGEVLPEITDALVTEEREFKVGRVLSARNFEAIKQAYELLSSVMQSASLNDGDEPGDEPEKSQHDEHEHKHTPDGPQDAPVTPTSREEAGPLSVPNAPAVSTVELQSKIAQFLTDMEGQS
jgi:hypothetical protein